MSEPRDLPDVLPSRSADLEQPGYTPGVKSGQRYAWPLGPAAAVAIALTCGGAAHADHKRADAPRSSATHLAKSDAKKEPSADEKALRGVVSIERAGQPLALGAVLSGDGRILTALSPLGAGNDLDARFADGSTVRVKIGHHDRAWDLALLVPQSGRWAEGLTASSRDPLRKDATIRSFAMRGKPAIVAMPLRGHRTLIGGDDKPLENALELGTRVAPSDLGAPIVDEEGRVVGILGRGCAPNERGRACTPVAFGAPTAAIRSFLRTVPVTAAAPAPWLGIQGVGEVGAVAKGVRILLVHPESPAEEAQLKGGDKSVSDTILAVDGQPVTTPEALADAIRSHAVGQRVPLTVFGQGRYRQVIVLLRSAPGPRERAAPAPSNPAELPPLGGEPGSNPAPPRPAPAAGKRAP